MKRIAYWIWGYSFQDACLHIGEFADSLKYRPVISAFTATATSKEIDEICKLLHIECPEVFINNLYRKNLIYLKKYEEDRKKKRKLLMKYLRKYHHASSAIYCNTRRAVDAVPDRLYAAVRPSGAGWAESALCAAVQRRGLLHQSDHFIRHFIRKGSKACFQTVGCDERFLRRSKALYDAAAYGKLRAAASARL